MHQFWRYFIDVRNMHDMSAIKYDNASRYFSHAALEILNVICDVLVPILHSMKFTKCENYEFCAKTAANKRPYQHIYSRWDSHKRHGTHSSGHKTSFMI